MKIVVIGMGYWGRIHIDKLIHLNVFDGACDIETDFNAFIKRKNPDGVVIATNSISHFPIAKSCIKRDISVYVEKPIATEIDQIAQYDRMLKKYDVRFQAGFQMLYDPIIQAHKKNGTRLMSMFRLSGRYRNESVVQTLMIHDIAIANYIFNATAQIGDTWGSLSEVNVNLRYPLKVATMTDSFREGRLTKEGTIIETRHAVLHSRYDIPKFRQISFLDNKGQLKAQSFDNSERPDLLTKSLVDWLESIKTGRNDNLINYQFARNVQRTVFKIERKIGLRN